MSIENSTTGSAPVDDAASAAPAAEVNETNPAPAVEMPPAPVDPGGVVAPQPIAAAAYTPNFKYKAALQEKELDAFWRPLVKDADSEKKVKEIFSKVEAFDFVKNQKVQAEKQLESMTGDYQSMAGTVQRFNESVKSNDLSSAFRLAGISKEQIFQWTQQQLQLMEMPPEQRKQYEQFEQAKTQKYDLEQKVTQLQQQYEDQAAQARVMQLDVALSRPEVNKFAEVWDQKVGQPGAFKNFVIDEAMKVFLTTQKDLPADQAVQIVMQKFNNFASAGESAQPPPQVVTQPPAFNNKPVIPNVTGKTVSPVKKAYKNLDEIKKLSKEMSS